MIVIEHPLADQPARSYEATIQRIPARSGEELDAVSPPYTEKHLSQKGDVVLLNTEDGIKVVPFERIADLTFKGQYHGMLTEEEFRNLLPEHPPWE